MRSNYYEDELNYLRRLGAEYAEKYPNNAAFLGSGAVDPDVERLLQGFAFLTGRLHERLDSQYSEIAEAFLSVLEPSLLRPIPAMAMVEFQPDMRQLRKTITIESGTALATVPREWGSCRFRTCRPVTIYPFQLTDLIVDSGAETRMTLRFTINPGSNLKESSLADLPLYLFSTDDRIKYGWYLWLTQYLKESYLANEQGTKIADVSVLPRGFEESLGLIPNMMERRTQLLREFFAFPESFLTMTVNSLTPLTNANVTTHFDLVLGFGSRRLVEPLLSVKKDLFRLYCVPAVNLFKSTARFTHSNKQREYRVRSDELDVEHHEIYSIDQVTGLAQGSRSRREYQPYYSRHLSPVGRQKQVDSYRPRFSDIHVKRGDSEIHGQECFVSLFRAENDDLQQDEAITLDVTCTNRLDPYKIVSGDLRQPTEQVPASIQYRDLGPISPTRPAPRSGEMFWLLLSSFSVSRSRVEQHDYLKRLLRLHSPMSSDGSAAADRWLTGLMPVRIEPGITVDKGCPLRLLRVGIQFESEVDRIPQMSLFGMVLGEFLRRSASVNTRMEFTISHARSEDYTYVWRTSPGSAVVL